MSLTDEIIGAGRTKLYIDGAWTDSSDGEKFDVLDPASGQPIAVVDSASVRDALDAVTAAETASDDWASRPPRQRGEILRRAFEIMSSRKDEIAELIVLEMGKALPEAAGEAAYAAEFFRWYSEEAARIYGSILQAPAGDKQIISIEQPVGVSLLITPWNFPAAMATRKIGPALAAGCTVLLKPASDTPLTALAIAHILEQAGVPNGVVNVIPSRRSGELAKAVLNDPRVRALSFTGSTAVGRTLLGVAAETVVNPSMELGGNAPFLVFEDADVEAAVDGAMVAKMRNGGQSCIAANRMIVHEAVVDEFSKIFAAAMEATKTGPGLEPGVELGPLINRSAQEDMVEFVGVSTGAGSSVATGGHAPNRPGFFFEPTVLTGVGRNDPILDEEIFGPLAPVVTFEDEDDAVALANDTEYGLASYLYTADFARGMRVAERLETGMVGFNRGLFSDPAAPFGGVKQSGIGREGGREGIREFTEMKYIAADWR